MRSSEQKSDILWGIGLNEIEEAQLAAAVKRRWRFTNRPVELPLPEDLLGPSKPFMVWIPRRVWQDMPRKIQDAMLEWPDVERVLILEEGDTLAEFENAWDRGFLSIVRMPLSRDKISSVLARAEEVKRLVRDIFRMAQEIELEREMLARKNNQLLFLNRILSRASESLDAETILTQAFQDLGMLLDINSLRAVLLHPAKNGASQADLYRPANPSAQADGEWTAYMLECAERLAETRISSFQDHPCPELRLDEGKEDDPRPADVLVLPLKSDGQTRGCICLHIEGGARLGRDQSQTMVSAVNHLALALHNSMQFKQVKARADYDGLTRIYNRAAFDSRLTEELRRGSRYSSELSLLMLDLDHFKSVNDTYGHTAGDSVLREVGRIIRSTVRTTDFPARFGGEEFAVILPHTSEASACALAERLRRRLAAKRFKSDGQNFKVTASIGVASVRPGGPLRDEDVIRLADQALFTAKGKGRNNVRPARPATSGRGAASPAL